MKYTDAYLFAEKIQSELKQFCVADRCLIAGSLRRKKKAIGDIEFVLQADPTKGAITKAVDLFETKTESGLIQYIRTLGELHTKCEETSRQIKLTPHGKDIMLDIYLPQPHDFYRQFAIRTGNWIFAANNLAVSWKKIGWVGTKDGLRRRDECYEIGRSWACKSETPTLPPVWKSEQEFFDFLQIPYVDPSSREWEQPQHYRHQPPVEVVEE